MLAQDRNKWNPSPKKQYKRKDETFPVFKDTFLSQNKKEAPTTQWIQYHPLDPPMCVCHPLLKCPLEHVLCHVAAESAAFEFDGFDLIFSLLLPYFRSWIQYAINLRTPAITLFDTPAESLCSIVVLVFFFFCSPLLSLLPSQTSVEVVIGGRESGKFPVDCYVMLKELWRWLPFLCAFSCCTHADFCQFWCDFMLTITKLSQFWRAGKFCWREKKYSISKHIIYM